MRNSNTQASRRRLSLAAGTVADATPLATARAASDAGFDATGFWVEPEIWPASTTRFVRRHLADTGLDVLDVEVLKVLPGAADPAEERILEIGAEVGASHALVICLEPDPARAADRFGELCERAADHGMTAVLEFMMFTEARTLADALEIVRAAGHPSGAVLVDTLHLARSGGRPADLRAVEPHLLPYAQLCDAPAASPREEPGPLIREALEERLLPGEGALPLEEFLEHFPAARPLSLEVRSAKLRKLFPEPAARARAVWDASRALLARVEG